MPDFSHHFTPHLSLIVHDHFPVHIVPTLAGIWSPIAAGVEQAELELQSTSGDATATRCFPYLVYVHLHRPRAPPAPGSSSDPLPEPPLGLDLAGDDDERGPSIARLI